MSPFFFCYPNKVVGLEYEWKTRLALTWDEVAAGTGFGCDPPGPKNIRRSFDFTVCAPFAEGAMKEDDDAGVTPLWYAIVWQNGLSDDM